MKSYVRKKMKMSLAKRLLIVAAIFAVQVVLLEIYIGQKNFLAHLSWNLVREAYIPSIEYKAKDHPMPDVSGQADSVPVLIYHGLIKEPDQTNTLVQDFRDQMFALKAAGYQTVSMEDYEQFMQGKKKLPAKSFLLTFDDGRKDSFYAADPILDALNYRATMFVISHHAFDEGNNSRYYLNTDELKTMVKTKRWDIEAHTYNGHDLMTIDAQGHKGYFYSNYLWLADKNRLETKAEYEQRVSSDLKQVKQDLERNLAVHVSAFAFPFGDYGQETVNNPDAQAFLTQQINKLYDAAFIQEGTSNDLTQNFANTDARRSTRIEVPYDWSSQNLLKMMAVGTAKPLPFHDSFYDVSGWINTQGSYALNGDGMLLAAAPTSTGAGVALDGARLWKDYSYQATVNWMDGQTALLIGRYVDANNYVGCSFSNGYTKVISRVNGVTSTVAEARQGAPLGEQTLSLIVKGSNVGCKLSDADAVNGGDPQVRAGGIGFSTWDPTPGTTKVLIRKIDVLPEK